MTMNITLAGTFLFNALLGPVCMMPRTFVSDMPMEPQEHMEMVMSPVIPMSPAHCEQCIVVKETRSLEGTCAGHCFARATESTAAIIVTGGNQIVAVTSSSIVHDHNQQSYQIALLDVLATSPPAVSTIVLRL